MKKSLPYLLHQTKYYPRQNPEKQFRIRQKRQESFLSYCRRNSPYLAKLWQDIPPDAPLSAYPVMTKTDMMKHFDELVTDRGVTLEQVNAFISDPKNIDQLFHKKYMVATTSGSTGFPAAVLYDAYACNVASAMVSNREMESICSTACIFSTKQFIISTGFILRAQRKYPMFKSMFCVIDADDPIDVIAEKLNRANPKFITSYAGNMELLSDAKLSGRLNIKPNCIATTGEQLSDRARKIIEDAFGCPVRSMYGSTEAGSIAVECKCHHHHVNTDWVYLEPVDHDGNPVEDGVEADRYYLTNYASTAQPIVRYEMTDRITVHREPCACGSNLPWVEITGRTNDVLTFDTDAGETPVRVPCMPIFCIVEAVKGVRHFQLVLHNRRDFELRLTFLDGMDSQQVFGQVRENLERHLSALGVTGTRYYLSDEVPHNDPKTAKFKQISFVND